MYWLWTLSNSSEAVTLRRNTGQSNRQAQARKRDVLKLNERDKEMDRVVRTDRSEVFGERSSSLVASAVTDGRAPWVEATSLNLSELVREQA
jgi:hypothetical protein